MGSRSRRCDENALQDLAASWPAPGLLAASVSCRRESGSCRRTATVSERHAVEGCPETPRNPTLIAMVATATP